MSIIIGDNFGYGGKKFLDSRESFDTLEAMKAYTQVPDGFVTYCKEDGKRYEFNSSNNINELTGKWTEFKVGSGDAGCYLGPDTPEEENTIWFFTGTEAASSNVTYDNPIISELFACIQTLQKQVAQLQADVEYLKINGGGSIPEEPDDPSGGEDPEEIVNVILALEDGGLFLLEDGGHIILEQDIVVEKNEDSTLVLEDGGLFLLESGGFLILEENINEVTESLLLLENGARLLYENGNEILLEQQ